ncbi:MAG: helix-turn-helix domain-containing protein [Candidatus Gastranaerophilaceae bacterium]
MIKDNKKLLGKRIKELRKQAGMTQERLAELIGIETNSLSGIERGRHFPSMPTLERISFSLNVEMKSLFEFNHFLSAEEMKSQIVENSKTADAEKIAIIYRILKAFDIIV